MDPEMQALRAQSQQFAAQGASFRHALAALPASFAGRPLCVTRTGIAHERELEAGPFEAMPAATVRVAMAAHPWFLPTEAAALAAVGQVLTLEGIPLKISSAKRLPLAGEIVLTLGKA